MDGFNETFAALSQAERIRMRKFYRKERKTYGRLSSKLETNAVARDIVHMKEVMYKLINSPEKDHK